MTVGIKNRETTFEIHMTEKEFGDFASAVDAICMSPVLMQDEKAKEHLKKISEFKNNMVLALNQ